MPWTMTDHVVAQRTGSIDALTRVGESSQAGVKHMDMKFGLIFDRQPWALEPAKEVSEATEVWQEGFTSTVSTGDKTRQVTPTM